MAALQDSGSNDDGRSKQKEEADPKRKRARSPGGGGGGGGAAPGSAGVRKEGSSASRGRQDGAAASVDMTVVDADALDCGVCFLPLKPPIFQCEVGHVVCSPCRDKLQAKGKCHVCGVATGSYRRCHAMERLVESIRVSCPHAAHGCTARPAYHDLEGHRSACPHAPCHCPGEACGFVGSTSALLDHVSEAHSWPCITNLKADKDGIYAVHLHDGFNFLLADCNCPAANTTTGWLRHLRADGGGAATATATATATVQCLLLLTVARQPVGCGISVLCIDPWAATAANGGDRQAASKQMECHILYNCRPWRLLPVNNHHGGNQLVYHFQQSTFRVACTDLSDGMPNPYGCFQFVLPSLVIGAHDRDGVEVRVRIYQV